MRIIPTLRVAKASWKPSAKVDGIVAGAPALRLSVERRMESCIYGENFAKTSPPILMEMAHTIAWSL